jgi:hypothetical protein
METDEEEAGACELFADLEGGTETEHERRGVERPQADDLVPP